MYIVLNNTNGTYASCQFPEEAVKKVKELMTAGVDEDYISVVVCVPDTDLMSPNEFIEKWS